MAKQKQIAHEAYASESVVVGSDKSFGLTIAVASWVIALILPWKWDVAIPWWLWVLGAVFFIGAFTTPKLLHPLNVLWMRFAHLLHLIISPVVLGVIFFLAVTPTALFIRMSGKDPLRLTKAPSDGSYWIDRDNGSTDLRKQY